MFKRFPLYLHFNTNKFEFNSFNIKFQFTDNAKKQKNICNFIFCFQRSESFDSAKLTVARSSSAMIAANKINLMKQKKRKGAGTSTGKTTLTHVNKQSYKLNVCFILQYRGVKL